MAYRILVKRIKKLDFTVAWNADGSTIAMTMAVAAAALAKKRNKRCRCGQR